MTIWNKEFQKWKMGIDVLNYFVENFFLVILRRRIFFVYKILSKKWILRSNFRDFTKGAKASSSDPVWGAKALIFWQVKINRFSGKHFFWIRVGNHVVDLK
jgi:hypothetical protein